MCKLICIIVLAAYHIIGVSQAWSQNQIITIARNDFGEIVQGYYCNVAIFSSNGREFYVRVYVARAESNVDPINEPDRAIPLQLAFRDEVWIINSETQVSWLCRFIQNRDGFFHTIVDLPQESLRVSVIILNLIDGENLIPLKIDLSECTWEISPDFIWQSVRPNQLRV